MEEQRASLTNLLLKYPNRTAADLADDLRHQVTAAVQHVDPNATVTVEHRGNLVLITPSVPSSDDALRHAVMAAVYEAKEAWYRTLLAQDSSGAGD